MSVFRAKSRQILGRKERRQGIIDEIVAVALPQNWLMKQNGRLIVASFIMAISHRNGTDFAFIFRSNTWNHKGILSNPRTCRR